MLTVTPANTPPGPLLGKEVDGVTAGSEVRELVWSDPTGVLGVLGPS